MTYIQTVGIVLLSMAFGAAIASYAHEIKPKLCSFEELMAPAIIFHKANFILEETPDYYKLERVKSIY